MSTCHVRRKLITTHLSYEVSREAGDVFHADVTHVPKDFACLSLLLALTLSDLAAFLSPRGRDGLGT